MIIPTGPLTAAGWISSGRHIYVDLYGVTADFGDYFRALTASIGINKKQD